MTEGKPSDEAVQALKLAQDALMIGQKQAGDIDTAKKLGYENKSSIDTHEQICAIRAQQTLDKVSGLDEKIDKLISVLLGALKVFATVTLTGAVGLIVWLIQTNGAT